jgi:hypothetical protein
VIIGAGLGGIPAAFHLRKHLPKPRRVTLVFGTGGLLFALGYVILVYDLLAIGKRSTVTSRAQAVSV